MRSRWLKTNDVDWCRESWDNPEIQIWSRNNFVLNNEHLVYIVVYVTTSINLFMEKRPNYNGKKGVLESYFP